MKYIIFLRAINVGGNRKIKMADLKEAFHSEGYPNITTYIQSGNVIAEREETNHEAIQQEVEALIKKHFDFDVPAVAFNLSEYEEVLKRNPFDEEKVMVHFLDRVPEEAAINNLGQLSQDDRDKSVLVGRFLFISLKAGVSDSLYSNKFVEKVLQVKATARNWNTVLKMAEKVNIK
ncbi:DUF1697 domain-containing protein [Listeria cornellensis]|uniref:DUF1697 domain-containing protein n=1 Tax=Listeria cornellensis FSL F6-0969 TaxID=1265820 RepID=W7BFH5_9LIST|nr:DUF1697 domain-containing protein [Listeria cornellensis]EUJ25849.1 hypothetical protein PCORN_16088 [Listeria cornellensis FSL F6-0969]